MRSFCSNSMYHSISTKRRLLRLSSLPAIISWKAIIKKVKYQYSSMISIEYFKVVNSCFKCTKTCAFEESASPQKCLHRFYFFTHTCWFARHSPLEMITWLLRDCWLAWLRAFRNFPSTLFNCSQKRSSNVIKLDFNGPLLSTRRYSWGQNIGKSGHNPWWIVKNHFREAVDQKYRRPIEKLVRDRRGANEEDPPAEATPCPFCSKKFDSYEVN